MNLILLHLVPATLYGLVGAWVWRTEWQDSNNRQSSGKLSKLQQTTLCIALVMHGYLLQQSLFANKALNFGFATALSLMAWLSVAFYWIESFFTRLGSLPALAMPFACLLVLLTLFFPQHIPVTDSNNTAFRMHIVVAMLSYGFFALAAIHALLMSIAEKQLHGAVLSRAVINLPPLLTLERLLFRIIWVGFTLLSLTLISGAVFSEHLYHRAFRFDHKFVFAIVSWLSFASLLAGRHWFGWRGRRAVQLTMVGFVFLILAYAGSRFVLQVILHRSI